MTQVVLLGEPRNLVGVNADNIGSYDPISSGDGIRSCTCEGFAEKLTRREFINRAREWDVVCAVFGEEYRLAAIRE